MSWAGLVLLCLQVKSHWKIQWHKNSLRLDGDRLFLFEQELGGDGLVAYSGSD